MLLMVILMEVFMRAPMIICLRRKFDNRAGSGLADVDAAGGAQGEPGSASESTALAPADEDGEGGEPKQLLGRTRTVRQRPVGYDTRAPTPRPGLLVGRLTAPPAPRAGPQR